MHILVIEDQQDFAQNIKRYLETESYSVDLAFDGEAGLQQALGEEYALVVLDLNLPRMDGLEVCRQLRQAGRTMPILMLTARIGHQNAVAGLDSGADDYLTKPFDLEELLARMRGLVPDIALRTTFIVGFPGETNADFQFDICVCMSRISCLSAELASSLYIFQVSLLSKIENWGL